MKSNNLHARFSPNVPSHIYQRSFDWGVIYYDDVLILAHFSLVCTLARMYDIQIYAMTYMINHHHFLLSAPSLEKLRQFMQRLTLIFTKDYNDIHNHPGPVFSGPFGYSKKATGKLFRTCHNYLANNAPEKMIVRKAIDYKWNFLRYAQSECPFSEKLTKANSSEKLWNYSREVLGRIAVNQAMKIRRLAYIKNDLSAEDWGKLVDFIISRYNVIDYNATAEQFNGNIETMIKAPDDNMGSEYEFEEDKLKYIPFYQMLSIIKKQDKLCNFRPFSMERKEMEEMIRQLHRHTDANVEHLALFFHIPQEDVCSILYGNCI